MIQSKLFERPRKRPANSMAAKLWDTYGTTEGGRSFFRGLYRGQGGEKPGRAADRATAQWLELANPRFKGITWRVVQDFRLKLGPAWGGGTHPHKGSKRKTAKRFIPRFEGNIEALGFSPRALFSEQIRRDFGISGRALEQRPEGPARANGYSDHMRCCDLKAALEPEESPAEPQPLKAPPTSPELAARFLERLLETGQVGLGAGRLSPEHAAQIAKRAAKALVDA